MRIGFTRSSRTVAAMLTCVLITLCHPARAQFAGAAATPGSTLTIPMAQIIQAEAVRRLMAPSSSKKPLLLQVGSHLLYAQAHIPGSEYAGQGSQSEGIQQLQKRVSAIPRKEPIILYCGCCPWGRCPNLGPAFAKLRDMGFTNVKVLYLADNFGADWVSKGYAVEQGR